MPTEKKEHIANAIERYIPFAALGIGFVAFILLMITNNKILSGRIFVTGLWPVIAVINFSTFYSGRFTWRHGPTFTRESSPILFYVSALFFCAFTMSVATLLLWGAYTSE